MGINRAAELQLAVLNQSAKNQLNAIDQKYRPFINLLSPEEKSTREQIEANLLHHFNKVQTQIIFEWLCSEILYERYLDKMHRDFLAILRANEAEEFYAEQETLLQNEDRQKLQWAQLAESDKEKSNLIKEGLEKRIKILLAELEKQIEQLHKEINALKMQRDMLLARIDNNYQKLGRAMNQVYRGCAQSNDVRMVDIGGFKLEYTDRDIAERVAKNFERKFQYRLIPPGNIDKEERAVISEFFYNSVPENNLGIAGRNFVEREIDKEHVHLLNQKKKQSEYTDAQVASRDIIKDERKVEIANILISMKEEHVALKKSDKEKIQDLPIQIKSIFAATEVSNKKMREVESQIKQSENLHLAEKDLISEDLDIFDIDIDDNDPDAPPPNDNPSVPGGSPFQPSAPPLPLSELNHNPPMSFLYAKQIAENQPQPSAPPLDAVSVSQNNIIPSAPNLDYENIPARPSNLNPSAPPENISQNPNNPPPYNNSGIPGGPTPPSSPRFKYQASPELEDLLKRNNKEPSAPASDAANQNNIFAENNKPKPSRSTIFLAKAPQQPANNNNANSKIDVRKEIPGNEDKSPRNK